MPQQIQEMQQKLDEAKEAVQKKKAQKEIKKELWTWLRFIQ